MSASYAQRLSHYPNKGVVGLKENFDTHRALSNKMKQLTELVKTSENIVILTGAGISTASKIPDFRGLNGIWTLEKEREKAAAAKNGKAKKTSKKRKRSGAASAPTSTTTSSSTDSADCSSSSSTASQQQQPTTIDFAKAQPTLTHRAITALVHKYNKVQYVITQNVDGLHRKSGLSRNYHSTVHGCVFTEKCAKCGLEVFGDTEVDGLSFQRTGNFCENCKTAPMHDILLDWEDMVLDLELCTKECEQADLIICLGTSLRINPVGSLPLLAEKFVICNLQPTPFDDQASLFIRAKVDDVMTQLMALLGFKDWDNPDHPPSIEREWNPPNGDNSEFAEILADKQGQKEEEEAG